MNIHAPAAGRALQLAGAGLLAVAAVLVTVAGTPVPALAIAAPSATVTPATGVIDGQTVTVTATGLPANHTIQVEECAGTVDNPPPDNTSCDGVTLDSSTDTDDQGAYSNTGFTAYTRPSSILSSPATITCDAGHPCVLYVGVDQNNFSAAHAFAALTFSAGVTTTTTAPPVSTTSTTTHTSTSSSSTTSTTAHTSTSTTSTTSHPTTSTTTCPRLTQSREPKTGCSASAPAQGTTATTLGPPVSAGALLGGTATTTTNADPADPTSPSDATATTGPAPLQASGDGGPPGTGDGAGPDPVPMLPRTGTPHAAVLLGVAGVGVVLGGTELHRRMLRGTK